MDRLSNLAVLLDRLGETDGAVEIAHRALQYFGHPHLVKIMESNKAAGGNAFDSNCNATTKKHLLNKRLLTQWMLELIIC